jgi:hypothetical protein
MLGLTRPDRLLSLFRVATSKNSSTGPKPKSPEALSPPAKSSLSPDADEMEERLKTRSQLAQAAKAAFWNYADSLRASSAQPGRPDSKS